MRPTTETGPPPARRVTVHEPGRRSALPLGEYLTAIWQHRAFITALGRAGERASTRATRLGPAWTVLNPLLLAAVYFLVIGVLIGGDRGQPAYLAQVVGSLFLFTYTRHAVMGGSRSITRNVGMVTSTTVPRATLPLAAVVAAARALVPMLVVYAGLHLVVGLPVGVEVLALLPLLVLHTALNVGLALGVAAATVQVRDVAQALPYLLRVAVYLSPVLYRAEEVTARLPDGVGWVLHLNPLSGLLQGYHAVLLDGRWPPAGAVVAAVAWAVAACLAGGAYFRARERGFALAA